MTVALRFLSYRERTEHEMREKLAGAKEFTAKEIDSTIGYLLEASYLNDLRFATELAHSRLRNKAWGRYKIRLDLKKRKIADEIINKVIDGIDDETELKSANTAIRKWLRKSGTNGPLSKKEFERAYRHLSARGFCAATALDVLAAYRNAETEEL